MRLKQKERMDFEIKFDAEKKFRQLEKRVELLELRRGHKQKEHVEWIKSMFDDKAMRISVKALMKEAKRKGYSWQMIQRARREQLEGKIEVVTEQGKGWFWTNDKRLINV